MGKYIFSVVLLLGLIELMSFGMIAYLQVIGIAVPQPQSEGYTEYLAKRDPQLGWPAPSSFGSGEIDVSGSRIVPNFPSPDSHSCVSLYGDSFTWGDEVGPQDAYGNVLSGRLNCRVSNFGVGGYGTDQALLRFKLNKEDQSPVVVLGHFSDNIVRNVNQMRDFIAGGRFGLKPRYIINRDGELELVPLPRMSEAEFEAADTQTSKLLPHEYFNPNMWGTVVVARWPYSISVVKSFFHYRIASRIQGSPSYTQFYDPIHPSKAYAVTFAIMQEFSRHAAMQGRLSVVLFIPDAKDLELHRSGVNPSFYGLQIELARLGISGPNVVENMVTYLQDRPACEIYTRCDGASHFNREGYELLANILYDWLSDSGLLALAFGENQH